MDTETAQPGRNASSKVEARRQQVLDAATRCFLREGFHGTSIARISREAGMSAGHIYHYFENKEAIVEGIAARERHEMLGMLDSLDSSQGTLAERMCSHSVEMLERVTRPDVGGLLLELAAEGTRNVAVREILQRSDHEMAEAFHARIHALKVPVGLDDAQVRERMQILIGLVKGMAVRKVHSRELNLEALQPIIDGVIRFLLPDPDPVDAPGC